MRCKIVLSLSLLLFSVYSFAQNFSNKGKEFWVGYGHHQYMEGNCAGTNSAPNDMNMVLYLSAEEPATVTVTIDSAIIFGIRWTRTYNIPANTVISTENLPKGSQNAAMSGSDPNFDARLFDNPTPIGSGGENLWRRKGIHITSNVPIVAYAHIYGGVSSGATMLMPVNTWGYSYTSVNSEQRDADRSYSWMYVIAKEDNTLVEITPSAVSRRGKPAGVPFQVLIQKGQIYQLVGQSDCNTGNGPELTGTTVKSIVGPDGKCHPVAVFGGSSRTGGETLTCGTGSGRDNDMQQLFPEHAWGKRYATAPFSKSTGSTLQPTQFQTSVYKVVVKDPATIVRRNGAQLTGLINAKYYKYSSNTADYITADKPIMMAQFMSGTTICNGGSGDPEMIILSPVEQAIKQVGFYRNTKEAISANYLTLVVPTPGVSSLRIDNSGTFNHTYPHPNLPGYTVVIKGWASAQSQSLVKCDSGFTAITYGLGGAESYGYNAGTFINNLSAIGSIHNTLDTTNATNSFTCTRTPVELSVLMAYKPIKMEWLLNTLSAVLTPNTNLTYNAPVVVDSPLVNGIKYYKYSLPGDYYFSDTGIFKVPVVVTSPTIDNCTQSDTIFYEVIVKGKPVADFTYTHSGCYTDTVFFTGSGTTGNYTINRWRWEFLGTDKDSIQNPKRVLPVGTHPIKLRVISREGCLGDTVRSVTINPPPSTDFTITPVSICEPDALYNFVSASPMSGITSFYWDFGNGNISNGLPNIASNYYLTHGTFNVKHIVRVIGQCPTDTVRKTITVFAKPRVNFGYPVGCLALDGTAQFTDSTIIPDGQAVTYKWYFGDANANAGNPDSSILKNPSHKYTAFGTYNVRLVVTTANGCSKDTTIACTFAVRPVLAFAPLASVCANSAIVSVAKGSTTNGVPGTGFYRGSGTDSAGNFNPIIAGAGVKTIWYVFTSTGGCKDSLSQTIKVHPKPAVAFAVTDTSFCLNSSTNITDNSTISSGNISQWKWEFGDGTFANYPNNTPFTKSYNTTGNFTIKLHAISDSSCVSDTVSRLVKVNALPVSNFTFTHTGCRLDTVSFTSQVPVQYVVNNWKWQFSNGDTSILENPKMIFGAGSFTARLTVTTADGCSDDTGKTFTVYNPPIAGFAASPITQCEPGSVNFTDTSKYLGSGAFVGSYWNFGNNNSVTNNNNNPVSQSYPVYGNYTIKHSVKVSDLCISDTAARTIVVYAKPRVNFGYPVGCLPLNNTARFSDSTIIPDGQAITYIWDFGDAANSTPSNPNTSTARNPSHIYINYGTYSIKLSVRTANGCVSDTTIQATFAVRPLLAFAPISSVCVNAAGTISVAKGSVTNGVPGTGIYRGPGTDTAGNFNPAVAGTGIKTIWYIFTSTGNCTDSISQTIRVNPKPVADFTLSRNNFCLDASTVLTGQSTLLSGTTASYRWDFGDATTANNPNNNPITKSYNAFGPYTIKLVTISDSSCVSDTVSKIVTVNPLPFVDFTLPFNICMPAGRATFTSLATIPGNGSLGYSWNFGDGSAASNQKDPVHIYSSVGTYGVRLTVISASGCVKDSLKTLASFFDQPIANFAVTPDTLCEGTPNVFTNLSTAPNSTLTAWNWSFGDGSFSTIATPLKQYSGPGTYNIKLAVSNAQGCLSDTFNKSVTVYLQPKINAGPSFTVPSGTQVIFKPTANDTTIVNFLWTPAFDFANASKFTQSLIALRDQVYFLTAVGAGNCTATDSLVVKVLKPLKIPNVFSPNADGINDTWSIPELTNYPGAKVTIFNRYGNEVLNVTGYSKAWDGTINGKALPVGVYYYIIDPKSGFKVITGSVTILR